jgi:glycosyltransferase involved in cell wall biosynthesis
VVTSVWLRDFVTPQARRVALVRNAAEYSHFAKRPAECFRDPRGRAVIGYYGALAEWFDVELVRAVAARFTDCLVLLIGHDQAQIRRALADSPNVKLLGEVSYQELPYYLHGFDVCLLPFRIVPLTLATNPVKLYEYLSAGKPVVSVDLPEARQCEGTVMVAESAADFLMLVQAALESNQDGDAAAKRQAFAAEQTWQHRTLELQRAVESVPRPTEP